jgi:hypothetical protein
VYGGYNAKGKNIPGDAYIQADQDKFTNEKTDTTKKGVYYPDYRNGK